MGSDDTHREPGGVGGDPSHGIESRDVSGIALVEGGSAVGGAVGVGDGGAQWQVARPAGEGDGLSGDRGSGGLVGQGGGQAKDLHAADACGDETGRGGGGGEYGGRGGHGLHRAAVARGVVRIPAVGRGHGVATDRQRARGACRDAAVERGVGAQGGGAGGEGDRPGRARVGDRPPVAPSRTAARRSPQTAPRRARDAVRRSRTEQTRRHHEPGSSHRPGPF